MEAKRTKCGAFRKWAFGPFVFYLSVVHGGLTDSDNDQNCTIITEKTIISYNSTSTTSMTDKVRF
jgi:hypothetical protein